MEQISAIIIDDEPLAREGLNIRMQGQEDFKVLAQCADGNEALNAIVERQPDVIFVDIEMPGLNGLQLVEALHERQLPLPKVVFVTAYKEFALQAFEYQAFDYLLKPFSEDRLEACLNNLRNSYEEHKALNQQDKLDELLSRKTGKSLDGFMHTLEQSRHAGMDELKQTISLKSGNEWLRVQLDSILWIEAAGDYMCVHTQDGTHIIRKTLKQFEHELDTTRFPRINRSAIVNLTKVSKLSPNSNGEYIASLITGHEVKVSRKYKFRLEELNRN